MGAAVDKDDQYRSQLTKEECALFESFEWRNVTKRQRIKLNNMSFGELRDLAETATLQVSQVARFLLNKRKYFYLPNEDIHKFLERKTGRKRVFYNSCIDRYFYTDVDGDTLMNYDYRIDLSNGRYIAYYDCVIEFVHEDDWKIPRPQNEREEERDERASIWRSEKWRAKIEEQQRIEDKKRKRRDKIGWLIFVLWIIATVLFEIIER